ncbi:MAG TPA: SDR family NAD(P)-dependent oxidoreductase [Thermoanaerobaculia bacterium]|jgi:3-oxoacyl-[acyl-carrier protein] reductase|nr:SDR family NAD(P)-dependent oxidoreductase [Thermoanaerobaculia bacterium]
MLEGYTIDLAPRTALITGGSRGIGRAAADLLARAGARVAINYVRDEAAANAAVREIRAAGGEAMALAGDVSQPDQARQLVRDVVAAWERLDIVVNNAGIWDEDPAGEGRLDVWDRTYAVNQRGAFLVTDAAVPHLAKTRGTIVFVSSTAGQRGEARHSAYAASKGALISYTKSLAAELGPRGIRVNCVAPGWVDTEMSAGALGNPLERAEIEKLIPIGRVASAADIAGPILFLVSDLARHLQGEVVNVNGGSVLAG